MDLGYLPSRFKKKGRLKMSEQYKEHEDFIKKNKAVLLQAAKIKKDPRYKRALHYFNVQKQRGHIKECPSESNNYQIVR